MRRLSVTLAGVLFVGCCLVVMPPDAVSMVLGDHAEAAVPQPDCAVPGIQLCQGAGEPALMPLHPNSNLALAASLPSGRYAPAREGRPAARTGHALQARPVRAALYLAYQALLL